MTVGARRTFHEGLESPTRHDDHATPERDDLARGEDRAVRRTSHEAGRGRSVGRAPHGVLPLSHGGCSQRRRAASLADGGARSARRASGSSHRPRRRPLDRRRAPRRLGERAAPRAAGPAESRGLRAGPGPRVPRWRSGVCRPARSATSSGSWRASRRAYKSSPPAQLQPDCNPTGPESPESSGLDANGQMLRFPRFAADSGKEATRPDGTRRTGSTTPASAYRAPLARPNDLELVLGGRRIDVARGVDGSDLELESSRGPDF